MAYFNEDTIVVVNGEFVKASKASTSLYAQTLHYGYGAFEGIRSYNTEDGVKIFKAKEHYERFHFSARILHIPFSYSVEVLTALTYELLERNNLKDAYIRPLIYASEPNMLLTPPKSCDLFIAAWEWPKYLGDKLLRIGISSYQRPNPKAFHIEAKASGHYVNSTLATYEAKSKGFDEALLLDNDGFVAEGPGANFFFEKNGKLTTPPRGNIMPGITRIAVIEMAKEMGIEVEERLFRLEELKDADGAFFTGTAAEIAGIGSVGDMVFKKEFNKTFGSKLLKGYLDLVYGRKVEVLS